MTADEIDTEIDHRRWTSSIAVGLAFAAAMMAFWFPVSERIRHSWSQASDVWQTVDAGRVVWHGALGYVYQGSGSLALPLSFIVMAPVSGIIDRFGLVEGHPYAVPHPSAWLLVAPYTLLFGVLLLHAVRRLAWDLGVRTGLLRLQVVTAVVVLVPCNYWGHFEDALAVTFVLYALRRWFRADYLVAGVFLSLAISSKQWAAMLLPLFLFLAPQGQRLRTALAASALPLAFIVFVLGADWHDASQALFSPTNLGTNTPGHLSFYATWLGSKTSRASRSLGLLLSPLVAWAFRKADGPVAILVACAVLTAIRPFSEAITYAYYWSPFLLLAGLVGAAAHQEIRWRDWIWPIGAVAWALPRGNPATTGWWWAGEAILLALTTAQMVINLGKPIGQPGKTLISVKAGNSTPISNAMTLAPGAGDASWTR
jgi:hypothetical protein